MSLDTLLTQIPYRNRTRVKVDIETVTVGTRKIGSLFPKIGNFVHVDGAENKLVFLGGTIPIFYGGATYNIPVDIYIPVNYPNETPFVYVRPTGNMIIKQNHRHVDMNGFVYLPYLHEWNSTHSLLPLIEVASSVFSIEPPLFTKPAATAATTNTTPAVTPTVTSSAANARATGYGGNASIAATATPYATVSSPNNTPTVVSAVPAPAVVASYPYAAVSAVPAVSSSVHGATATANHSYYGNGYASNQYAAVATPATTANNNHNNNNNTTMTSNATTAPNSGYSFGGLAFAANFARNLTNSNAYDVNTNANVNNAAPSNSSASNAYYPSSTYGTNYAAVPVPVPVAATTNTSSSSSTGGNYLHHHAAANTNTNTANSAALSLQTSQQNQVIAQQIAEKRHRLLQDVTYAMRAALQAKYEACRADILREMANEQYLQRSKEQLEALRQSIRDEELPRLRAAHQMLHEKVAEVRRLRNPAEPQLVETTTTTTTTTIPAAAASTTMTMAGDETKAEQPEPAVETSTTVLSDAESINNNNNDNNKNNNNNKATAVVVVNLEDNLLPTDDLSVQITKLQGDLQGCRDIFYVYEQALLQHRVDLKVFGKDVRDWARQEFLCKAHLRKIERIAAGSVGKTV